MVLYECSLCNAYHPWNWDGDCRDDDNRIYDLGEYASKHNIDEWDIEIRSMDERIQADCV